MAHDIDESSTCSEDFQTASEGLGRFTSSELKAIVQRNHAPRNGAERLASSGTTNPFTVSQLRANLDHHRRTYPQPDEDAWPSCSGSTNPFTSIQLRMIHGRHEHDTRSKKKLGTRHPALQGPVLEPGGPNNRRRLEHHNDPSKRGGTVDEAKPVRQLRFAGNGKPTKLARHLDYHRSRKQVRVPAQSKPSKQNRVHVLERGESSKQNRVHVLERGESSKQNRVHVIERGESSKQGARAGAQPNRNLQRTRGSPPAICRQSITRATLQLGMEGLVNISTQMIGLSEKHVLHSACTSELALTQSQHDFGIKLRIAKLPSDDWKALSWPLELDLFFDPNSDAVLLVNNTILDTRELLVIKQLPIVRGKRPTRIGALEKTALEPSCSYRFLVSDRHMFDITVLPRRYVALTSAPLRLSTQGVKRTVDMLSQQAIPSAAKRTKARATHGQSKGKGKEPVTQWKGKGKESSALAKDKGKGKATDDASDAEETTDASTVIQTRPPSNELVVASASPFPSGSDLRAGYISAVDHPLNDLPENATIKIASATREEDYTLLRRDNIAKLANTLVFKAHHSKIPGKLVAVKIWHSVFDLDFVPGAGVKAISQVSEYFLRELKNHMKVSEHPMIASLYSFDVRFLALYIEHINARDLAKHRGPGRNPLCTLDDSDAKRVLHDMAGALEFIHSRDVVHNDIKPSNILYTKERGPILIDFGWSSDAKTVHVAGSPWYIPPEYLSDGTRGPAGDIFAFGVVMLYLMRKIPLPELLSPPLKWHIGHLRSKGREALGALETMTQWLQIVKTAVDELQIAYEESGGGMLEDVVTRITEFEVDDRQTGHGLVWMLKNYGIE
ncbi:hypothetical protein J3F83DRAFT_711106 [Trichoderma novae-zelandiae]